MAKWDSKNLEIRSKSVEQTLIPLVSQITTLVNHKERSNLSEKARHTIQVVGEAVKNAVLKFVSVGEQISRENKEVSTEMMEACDEAKRAGEVICRLTSVTPSAANYEKTGMVRAARSLLSAVTRVLIIADSVMIKRLLVAVKKVDDRLQELETINSFTEFVQTFSQFGAEMVELAHLSGDRQNMLISCDTRQLLDKLQAFFQDLKDDCLRAEMCCARSILEKSTMMLLTTSKTCLRHPGSMAAKGNRNGVFCKMREAMKTIRLVTEDNYYKHTEKKNQTCLAMDIRKFENTVEAFRKSTPGDHDAKINFQKGLEKILLDIEGVIDAPHTRKEKRERIIALCENAQDIMKDIIEKHLDNEVPATPSSNANSLDLALQRISKAASDLRHEVHQVATDQVFETFSHQGHKKSLPALRSAAAIGDINQVENAASVFTQDAKRLEDVSKVARSVSVNEAIAITAKNIEDNLRSLCPQVVDAARTLAAHPVSKIAQENMDVFIDIWDSQVEELGKVLRGITAGGDLTKRKSVRLSRFIKQHNHMFEDTFDGCPEFYKD